VWKRMGEMDRAIADFSAAIRIDPTYINAYLGRADAYLGRFAPAALAVAEGTKPASALDRRADLRARAGDLAKAIADYGLAIRFDPTNEGCYFGRGVAYFAKGDIDDAIVDLTIAIRLDPKHALTYGVRGRAYEIRGEKLKASDDFARADQLRRASGRNR